MTTFVDSIVFLVSGVSRLAHSGDTIQISSNLTIGAPISFTSDNSNPILTQITVPGAGTNVGQNLTIQAQSGQSQTGSAANNNGGNLILSSGSPGTGGSGSAGNVGSVQLQAAGTTIAKVDQNKFYSTKGYSRNVTPVTSNYEVLLTDDLIAVGTITTSITVMLPSSPNIGDCYSIKDTKGLATTFNILALGNGNDIDGVSSYTLSNNYECLDLIFTGSWSII